MNMAIDPVSIGTAAIAVVSGLFKSKKHYNLYYFEESDDSWKYVANGHPSQLNPIANDYRLQGIVTAMVRNKDNKYTAAELMPKEPPKGYQKNPTKTNWLVIFITGGTIGLVYFLIHKRRK